MNGLVTSRLDYCNALLYGLPKALTHKLQRVQNTAAHIVTRTSQHSHITPVLQELHWLPVDLRIKFKILMYTYKGLHEQAPGYICDMLHVYKPARTLRSMDSLMLVVPKSKYVHYGERHFKYASAKLCNELSYDIRKCSTLRSFKQALKTYLFKTVFAV